MRMLNTSLERCIKKGKGVKQDDFQMMKYFKLAADQDHYKANIKLYKANIKLLLNNLRIKFNDFLKET